MKKKKCFCILGSQLNWSVVLDGTVKFYHKFNYHTISSGLIVLCSRIFMLFAKKKYTNSLKLLYIRLVQANIFIVPASFVWVHHSQYKFRVVLILIYNYVCTSCYGSYNFRLFRHSDFDIINNYLLCSFPCFFFFCNHNKPYIHISLVFEFSKKIVLTSFVWIFLRNSTVFDRDYPDRCRLFFCQILFFCYWYYARSSPMALLQL